MARSVTVATKLTKKEAELIEKNLERLRLPE